MSIHLPLASDRVRYGLVLFVATSITISSVISSPETTMGHADFCTQSGVICFEYGPFGIIKADKWGHGTAYAILTATLAYAFVDPVRGNRHRRLTLSVCFAIVFGICLEFAQWPIPDRSMSELDAIANAIGAFLMAILWWKLRAAKPDNDEALS
ncbi:VanZ family protein [Halocatena marina]|uniref:VanZ family protein n=1 Tax=Halocatena marina TaxID=2934937 RepID=UPI00200EDAD9|nr:VanZ family protein [Halocatena marina]